MSARGAIGRREFVATCSGCAALLLTGCASLVTHAVPVSAGRARVSLAAFPELASPGGTIRILPDGMTDPIYVLARENGEFGARSPICTHRGCTVDVSGDRLVCPCHGSTYDRDGRVLKGPAQRALARYPVMRSGDQLVIEVAP
jgi:thiosulfate dehydrogenase [quinone] large subunit